MTIPNDILNKTNKSLTDYAILSGYRGSIAHGMYTPKSDPNSIDDKDIMGVCVPPLDYYFSHDDSFPSNGTKEVMQDEWDIVIYESSKFINLLKKGNPNVLALLWLEPNYYIKNTPAGQLILTHKNLFVGKHVYHSFIGYAYGQLHRMEHGGKYQGHASAKRKELVKKYGYDCKNAAHLIRLLRMGIEFLVDGELHVLREDASQLLEIKHGQWTLQQVKTESDRLFKLAEESFIRSHLPIRPDDSLINRLSTDVIMTALKERKEL